MEIEIYEKLAMLFSQNGFSLYIIGGTSRDYLLGLGIKDFDFVTDATPNEMKKFLTDANYSFEKYGNVFLKFDGIKVDITTLRKEDGYGDFRHPSKITFVKSIEEDFLRRDFTINAIYIAQNGQIIDPSNGLEDLKNKVIRFIGNPETRIKEDPLRILRAERFASKLGFEIETKTLKAINNNRDLIKQLNPQKVQEELRKRN